MFDAHWSENGHVDAAAELLAQWARSRRFRNASVDIVRLHDRTPVLLVTVEATNDDDATVVLYGHFDKQPPLGDWSEGLAPYVPVRREDRLYADLQIEGLIDLPADQRYKKVLSMSVGEQIAFANSLRNGSVKTQDLVTGILVISAVALDQMSRRRQR